MNRFTWFSILGLTCLSLPAGIVTSCSQGSATPQLPEAADASTHFVLSVDLESTLLDGASVGAFTLDESNGQDGCELLVSAVDATGLKAAYFTVSFDPQRFIPVTAEPLAGLGEPDGNLHVAVLGDPGLIHFGQVLKNWDEQPGFSGDLPLARLTLRRRHPGDPLPAAAKAASVPPLGDDSRAFLLIAGTNLFQWLYGNQGDYNQDGLVGIEDLTPLGLHFNETGPFLLDSAVWMVDGNDDGEINISDITPIGLNFGASVLGGYNIYVSTNPSDYPASSSAVSVLAPVDSVTLAFSTGDRAVDRRAYFRDVTHAETTFYAWVRPVDEVGTEGVPSERRFVDLAGAPALALVTAPLGGTGSLDDPFVVDAAVDYELSVTHPTLGDVTSDPGTELEVIPLISGEDPGVGDTAARQLQIADDFTGMFTLTAYFNSIEAVPFMYFRVVNPANIPPTAFFMTDVNSGVAPLDVNADAAGSSDADGMIIFYDWDFEDDGTWDVHRSFYGGAFADIFYTVGGRHTIKLQVTDDEGATGVTTWPIDVEGWQKVLVDDRNGAGTEPCLAVIGGRPAIAYGDSGGNANYIRAADAAGSAWNDAVSLSDSSIATQISMMEVAGGPAIVFRRAGGTTLGISYYHSAGVDGAGWSSAAVSSNAGDTCPSLQVVNGNPAVAYVWDNGAPETNHVLSYMRSFDATGTGPGAWDGFPSLIFSAEFVRLDKQSLILTQDKPAIVFVSNDDELGEPWRIRYVIADDISATGWGFPNPIFTGSTTTTAAFLAVCTIVSRANICYLQPETDSVIFCRALSLDGGDWGSNILLSFASNSDRGHYLDIANVGGFPAVCHYDAGTQELRYARTADPDAGTWPGSVVANVGAWYTPGEYNNRVSLASLAGLPMIAYFDDNDKHLYFSTFYEVP